MQIVNVHRFFNRLKTKLIGRPVGRPPFHSTPARTIENPAELWSRPNFDFPALVISTVGVRPNSPPMTISMSSNSLSFFRKVKSLYLTLVLTRENPTGDWLARGLKNGNLLEIIVNRGDTIVIQLNFNS